MSKLKKVYRLALFKDEGGLVILGIFSSMKKVKKFMQNNYPEFTFDSDVSMYFDKVNRRIISLTKWEVQ